MTTKKKIKGKFSIYSRFTWHSINEKNENILLKKISKLPNLEYIFIEARSVKDDLFGVGKKLGKNEYWTPNLFPTAYKSPLSKRKNIETMEMETGFIEEEFQDSEEE